jgi:hypothetical protein
MASGTENKERWAAKLEQLKRSAREALLRAQVTKADLFMGKILSVIPKEHGELAATVKADETETGAMVAVGGPEAPYPLHLDAGHLGPGGVHVAAVPFYYVSRRALKKKFASIDAASVNKAVRAVTSAGGGA